MDERHRLLGRLTSSEESLTSTVSYGGMRGEQSPSHHAKVIFYALSILTLGIFRLIVHWSPVWYIKVRANASTLNNADLILVIDDHDVHTIRPVRTMRPARGHTLYLPSPDGSLTNMKISTIHEYANDDGMSTAEVLRRRITYGFNLIDVKLKPIYVLLFKEAITPFYIFQVFSVAVWFSDQYAYYASVIIFMSVASITMDVYQMRQQDKNLRSMIHSTNEVEVVREGSVHIVSSQELVPGDVIVIPRHGCTLQCDVVLMNGTVIVNESMLTGESVPITKVAITGIDEENSNDELRFDINKHSKHVLFCGTSVLQTRFYGGQHVTAVVIRTAYSTLKGHLVRSIMYPKPVDFRFTRDLFKFVAFLACIAMGGFAYTFAIMFIRGNSIARIIVRSLDIITITVPPALPAAMTVGIINSNMRLKKKEIFCISPTTINTCGAINVVCFDKTGTLTEDGLDFLAMIAVREECAGGRQFMEELREMNVRAVPNNGELVKAIAMCHSLTRIDGVLNGDPLDLILFNQTKWNMEEAFESGSERSGRETRLFDTMQPSVLRPPDDHNYDNAEYTIIRQFTFSSSLQRMSVIVGSPDAAIDSLVLYSKGSPEMIQSLCRKETVPLNYMDVVNEYAQHGYRLIAVAYRKLDIGYTKASKIARAEVETDLELLGLVVMENRLKPQTLGVINQLNRAKIRTVMVTGDNLLTGLSVARECAIIRPDKKAYVVDHDKDNKDHLGRTLLTIKLSVSSSEDIIDEASCVTDIEMRHIIDSSYQLAVSGPTFAVITHEYPELLEKLVCVCDVFARMAPDQKKQLVNQLQDVNYTVAMCGDGANDCAALKAAHAGISLSEAEASIAAPFTSKKADITCVPEVIREGRAALVTSFGVFKYMAGYSLTQFITIMQLYWLSTNLTDMQFLYIDLILITSVAFVFGKTPACEHLSSTPPPSRLLSISSVISIVGQLLIIAISQLSVFVATSMQPWFSPFEIPLGDDEDDKRSMQGTAIFGVSVFQYIALAVIYSKGAPYRKTITHNIPLCVICLILSAVNIWIVLAPSQFIIDFLEYDAIPFVEFRLLIAMASGLSIIVMFAFETLIIDVLLHEKREKWMIKRQLRGVEQSANRYEQLLVDIGSEPAWLRSTAQYLPADNIKTSASALSLLTSGDANAAPTATINENNTILIPIRERE